MGYYVDYTLVLRIPAKHFKRALEIFNELHSDEMLLKHARGRCFSSDNDKKSVSDMMWYSWVRNPDAPYKTLKEAFENWAIVEDDVSIYIDEDTHDFVIRGSYENKWGQQDFLIEQLAPVLRNTVVQVSGEDRTQYLWIVEEGEYRQESWQPPNFDEDDILNGVEVNPKDLTPENLALAM